MDLRVRECGLDMTGSGWVQWWAF